jgi:hypothetical protein
MRMQLRQDRMLHESTFAQRQLVPAGALICSASLHHDCGQNFEGYCATTRAAASLYAKADSWSGCSEQALPLQQPFASHPTECIEYIKAHGRCHAAVACMAIVDALL